MTTSPRRVATTATDGQIDKELYERAAYSLIWKFDAIEEQAAKGRPAPRPQPFTDPVVYRAYADKLGQHANNVAGAARCIQALNGFLCDAHMRLDRLDPSLRAELEQRARELGSAPWGGIPLSAFPDPEDVE
ncbi:hypothetical protein [Rubrivivax gelatinosus]|uniref:Uncharacterized protein n=1 Tax=Rubrivivax gelatinosus TaxID=28068 RepID=A0A4R2MA17_RUBGE|nr:hypothetical protein [Rubrivivax gelatinosus]MBK1688891.1 hypothetical protein [Rubrivivax gelatinosus]TCP03071.1 hypothetical protein EV684_105237 [Rubrivivax gelatinosus]